MIHLPQPITKHLAQKVRSWFDRSLEVLNHYGTPFTGDQGSPFHVRAYERVSDPDFTRLYSTLVNCVQADLGLDQGAWCVQAVPTFRFQLYGDQGTKEYHRDMDYGHPIQSLNVVVPLTQMLWPGSFEVETVPYSERYERVYANVGEVVVFNGATSKHGSVQNYGNPRVSFDFRFAMKEHLTGKASVSYNKKLSLGEYYREL